MEVDVYADVVFLINWSMDAFILWVAGRLAQRHARLWRLLLGSAAMAVLYCLVMFVTDFHIFYSLISSVIMLMIGIAITFLPMKVVSFFKVALFAYISTFLLGGIGTALSYMLQRNNITGSILGITISNFSLPVLMASTAAFFVLFRFISDWLEHRAYRRQVCMPVRIFFDNQSVELIALVDTGNSLRDPISQTPVIVAEFESVKAFLPDNVKLLFYEKHENDLQTLLSSVETDAFTGRLRMIPYESLGRQNGMLIGFRPDRVEILRDKDIVTLQDVVIGVYNFTLSRNGDYQGLLNPELIA
jgi:stage II sporulation protein GA (sporulation sigma-E factor processing peptidase)